MKKMLISIALILGCLIFKNTVYASCSISAFTNNSIEIDDNYICLANESVSSNSSKTAYNDN